ncbi:MAG: GtrA family protein [Alphaproteobacteria bacterium]|nr:GtrA family protein [Alphaproteobacteria bacterium]
MFRFIMVGLVNSLLGYSFIFGFTYLLAFSPEKSNIFGYLLGIIVSYTLHKKISFMSSNKINKEFLKFIFIFIISFGINFCVLFFLLHHLKINSAISQIIAGFFYVFFSYFLNKIFVFNRPSLNL